MPKVIEPEQLAVATIIQEAANEPYKGKLAVARVIRNRMRLKYASDGTVAGTVLRDRQFSGWNNKPDKNRIQSVQYEISEKHVQDSLQAWLMSEQPAKGFDKVVLYHADYVKPAWAPKVKYVRTIGRHLFYEDD